MQHQFDALTRAFPHHLFEQKTQDDIFYLLTDVQNSDCYIWKEPGYIYLMLQEKERTVPELESSVSPICQFTTLADLIAFLKALL